MEKLTPTILRGIVIASAWGKNGEVTAVDIADFNERRYRVADDRTGIALRSCLKKRIIAKGILTKENNRHPSKFSTTGYEGYKVSLKLVREGIEEYDPVYLSNSEDVYEFMQEIEDNDRESFYSIHLDSKNKIMSCEEVSRGGGASTTVCPREVFKAAVLTSAQGLVFVHNHPSGDPRPSPEDLAVSRKLYDCGELLGIKVFDSVIVGKGSYYSLGDNKQLNKLD